MKSFATHSPTITVGPSGPAPIVQPGVMQSRPATRCGRCFSLVARSAGLRRFGETYYSSGVHYSVDQGSHQNHFNIGRHTCILFPARAGREGMRKLGRRSATSWPRARQIAQSIVPIRRHRSTRNTRLADRGTPGSNIRARLRRFVVTAKQPAKKNETE